MMSPMDMLMAAKKSSALNKDAGEQPELPLLTHA